MSDDIKQWAGPIAPPDAAGLADRYAVSQLCKVYALGIDMRDLDLVLSVFDKDGRGAGTVGELPLHEYLTKTYQGAANFKATQHTILNQYVTVDGDQALLWSYAVAYHIQHPESGLENLTVGVQYRDHCHRGPQGWLVHERRAVVQWVEGPRPGNKA
jgi:hypothetical protein